MALDPGKITRDGLDKAAQEERRKRPATTTPTDHDPPPFRCIGYTDTAYYFLLGRQRLPYSIDKGSFTASRVGELAPAEWWGQVGAVTRESNIDVGRAQKWIHYEQGKRGFFRPENLRGAGVWREGGEVVVNDGERIVHQDGASIDLSEYEGPSAYIRSMASFGDMTGEAADAQEGRVLAELIRVQGFSNRMQALAVLGWSLIAPFGGVLHWRPHLWISGRKGTGKSWVMDNIVTPLCGPFAHTGSGKDTEAGIRRTLNQDARPVILDEMEPKNKNARENVSKILDLMRNASSDSSARVTMASGSEGTTSFLIRSCFCFASVNIQGGEGAAVDSRIIIAELRQPTDERAKIDRSLTLYGKCMAHPERYRRRIFRALPRILEDIEWLRDHLLSSMGERREADMWAPILAAAWAVQSDDSVREAGKWLASFVEEHKKNGHETEEDEDRVVEHILSAQVRLDDTKTRTIAEILGDAEKSLTDHGFDWANDLLSRNGLKLREIDGVRILCIATKADQITRILSDTPYATGYDAQIKRNPACIGADEKWQEHFKCGRKIARRLDWAKFKDRYMGGEG